MTRPASNPHDPPVWLRWGLRAAVVLPLVVAAVRAVATGWFPVGDSALLAIRAFDVGTSDHPLLGSWTSASLTLGTDVNNPGPLYADLLAPFMWTIGRWFGIGTAVAVGVASINAGFALLAGWIGSQLGGWRAERWALLMVAALGWSMGSELLIDIWQPHALLIPFACLLLLTVGLLDGRWRLAPVWLGITSLILQTHIGYVYVLAALGILVLAHGVVAFRSSDVDPHELVRGRAVLWSGAVLGLAWIQPVIEQLVGDGRGNLARLATNAGGGDVTIGASTAVKLVARVVVTPPWWTRSGFEDSVTSTPLTSTTGGSVLMVPNLPGGPLALAGVGCLVIALTWLTWVLRRRDLTVVAAATLTSLVGVVTAVVTLTIQTVSIVGLGSHHVRWLWVLSLFVQISVAWAIVELGWLQILAPRATLVLAAVIGVLTVANLGFTAHDLGPTTDRAAGDTLARTFGDLTAFEPAGTVLYDIDNLRPFEPWSSAVQMRLRELGVEFRVDDDSVARQLGNGRRSDGSEVTTIRQVERGAAVRYDGPGCVLSRASPFGAADERAIDEVIGAAVDDVAAGSVDLDLEGLDADLVSRFERALDGDTDEAFVLVADGLLPFLEADGRLLTSSPAIEEALAMSSVIDRRVVGTLVLVTEPPLGCD